MSILRLEGISNGEHFNLGVIDNKQTGSDEPINEENIKVELTPSARRNLLLLVAVLALILLLVLLAPILPYIVQAVLWIILLPFKALGALFKSIKNAVNKNKRDK